MILFKIKKREEIAWSGVWKSGSSDRQPKLKTTESQEEQTTHLFSVNSCFNLANCSAVNAVLGLFSSAFFSPFFFILRDLGPGKHIVGKSRRRIFKLDSHLKLIDLCSLRWTLRHSLMTCLFCLSLCQCVSLCFCNNEQCICGSCTVQNN